MTNKDFIIEIREIIINKTVSRKIPTVVFISIKKEELVKNILWTIKGGNWDESNFTPEEWAKTADIMQMLTNIPLLIKETADIKEIKKETEAFISGMGRRNGIVIINSKEKISTSEFTTGQNISIIII